MTLVWLTTLRRGAAYHAPRPEGHYTSCGRWYGHVSYDMQPVRGHLLDLDEAIAEYQAVPCRRCNGEARVVKPRAGRGYR
jgi:hypothetical protein